MDFASLLNGLSEADLRAEADRLRAVIAARQAKLVAVLALLPADSSSASITVGTTLSASAVAERESAGSNLPPITDHHSQECSTGPALDLASDSLAEPDAPAHTKRPRRK